MKNVYLILVTYLLSFISYGQSRLIVFAEDGDAFTMTVDGSSATNLNASKAVFDGIKEDFVQTTITFKNPELGVLKKGLMIEPNVEITAVIKKNKKGEFVLRPVSFVAIENAPNRPLPPPIFEEPSVREEVAISSGNTNTTTISESTTSSINVGANDPEMGVNMNVNINLNDFGASVSSKFSETTTTSSTTTTTTSSNSNGNTFEEMEEIVCYPMSTNDFASAKKSIGSKSFAEDKMTLAKQVLRANCVSTDQVIGIMNLFSFEDNKLAFAKFAYEKTTDKGNYYKINDAFTYSSSIDELNEFLEGK